MAFRQPAFVPQRSTVSQSAGQQRVESPRSTVQPHIEQSQEWILFPSRHTESSIAETQSSITERTGHTEDFSRQSDLQSFDSAFRSGRLSEEVLAEHELDSLDDNLHAFRETGHQSTSAYQFDQNGGSVLPTHDGLGTFPSSIVQEQIWQHEQHNPKRKFDGAHPRRTSVHRRLDTIEETDSHVIDEEKRLRIERWRLDQSRALLIEIERETRREARKRARTDGNTASYATSTSSQETPTASILGTTPTQQDLEGLREDSEEVEPIWTRLTRRFIRDVIGIDESLLSVIFGESLPENVLEEISHPSIASLSEQPLTTSSMDQSWKNRLLHRVAKELGVFVDQLPSHPGAFSTFQDSSESVSPIQRSGTGALPEQKDELQGRPPNGEFNAGAASFSTPMFNPTAPDGAHEASWGMDDDEPHSSQTRSNTNLPRRATSAESDYWERDMDVRMLFRFLRDRFTSSRQPQPTQSTNVSSQDSARRAAVIRQHHPLVARAHQRSILRSRREASLHLVRRSTSSCASQSLRSSKRGSLVRSGGSSRNYWDIGGSMGSESAIASGGFMGAWGEV